MGDLSGGKEAEVPTGSQEFVTGDSVGAAAKSLLFEVKGHDPLVLAGSVVTLALVAMLAGLVPALRASRIDPMQALRYE